MRIIGGAWRGRPIKAPAGADTTRPTTDRVRESIASIVVSEVGSLEGMAVLDAFAGSGALSLELLSRGAATATLFDQDQKALACIRDNVAKLSLGPDRVRVVRGDVLRAGARAAMPLAPYDVVLLDPPYALSHEVVGTLLGDLARNGCLAKGCVVVYERAVQAPGVHTAGFTLASEHHYGTTAVDLLVWEGPADS